MKTRTKKIAVLVPLIWGSFAMLAGAQDKKHPLEIQMDQCMEKDSSTMGMHACLDKFAPQWDALLNKTYAQLGGDKNPELRQAQVAWLKFRDSEKAWTVKKYDIIYKKSQGGTMWGLLEHSGIVEITKERALKLFNDYELLSGNVN